MIEYGTACYVVFVYKHIYRSTQAIVMALAADSPNLNELILLRALALRDAPIELGGYNGNTNDFLVDVGWSHEDWQDWFAIFRLARNSITWDRLARSESMKMQTILSDLYAERSFSDIPLRCCVYATSATQLDRNNPNLHELVLRRAQRIVNKPLEYGGYNTNFMSFLHDIQWSQEDWDIWISLMKMPRWDEIARDESMYMQMELYRVCMLYQHGISIDTQAPSGVARVLSAQHGKKTQLLVGYAEPRL